MVHRTVRDAHARERSEDYVEAIADLIAHAGEARVTDLAEVMGVSHVTVVRAIARLRSGGLVHARPYRAIFLTPKGARLAASSKHRHQTVVDFLLWLGVAPAVAARDAEGIEHHVSAQTLAAMARRLKRT